jgi:elongation factor Ts
MATTEQVKELREITGAGFLDCKRALEEVEGDIVNAVEILRQRGLAKAEKKAKREVRQGLVEAYIHTRGRIGVLVEVNCETDFVAQTNELKELAHDLAMQVAATDPSSIGSDELHEEVVPSQACLLQQPFIKDPEKTVQDIITETIAKVGENIKIGRFARFELAKE